MNHFQKELEEVSLFLADYQFTNKELIKELNALVLAEDDVVLLLYSRRGLEVIISEMCEEVLGRDRGSEPMKGLIDKMYKEKAIPAFIHTSMSNLNSISTYGAHPKEFNQRQVKTTIIELTTVLEWYVSDYKKLIKTEKQEVISNKKKDNAKQNVENTEEPATSKQNITAKEHENVTDEKKSSGTIYIVIGIVVGIAVLFYLLKMKGDSGKEVAQKVENVVEDNKRKEVGEIIPAEIVEKQVSSTMVPEKVISEPVEKIKTVQKNDLPDNIGDAFNKVNDFKSFNERRTASVELLSRFSNDAGIKITNMDETHSAKEYISKTLIAHPNWKYKNAVVIEKSSDGKISRLMIEEVR